jgi:hypothetical protein
LELYEIHRRRGAKECSGRQAGFWQLSKEHGGLVAGLVAGAAEAVLHDLVLEVLPVGEAQVETLEKSRDSCKETDALDSADFCLIEESVDEKTACSFSHCARVDGDGSDLGEVGAIDVKRGTADELAGVCLNDGEGVNVLADLVVGTRQKGSVTGEAVDQLMDCAGVAESCSSGAWRGCL